MSNAELMYRPPGRPYITLPQALDELYNRIEALEKGLPESKPQRNFFIQLLTRWH